MTREALDQWFINKVMDNKEHYAEDYKKVNQAVASSKAIYKGKPVPFLYMPKFYTEHDLASFNRLTESMMKICRKMIDLYRSVPLIRKKYNFDSRLEALILKDEAYRSYVPMARFDVFYYGPDDFMFCELNTDGTSAMNEDMILASILGESEIVEEMSETFEMRSFELFDTWVKEVQNIYTEATGKLSKPTVAIVDFIDKGSNIEFEEFKLRFEKAGFEAYIADPRDLTYDDGLMFEGVKLDVVYRRLVTRDMMDRIDEIPAFEKACLDNKTVVIGNIRSQVVHTKVFFELLFDESVREFFTKDELAFIDRHVPYTDPIRNISYSLDKFVENKDQYLIKPLDFYASIGVYAGASHTSEEWRKILEEHLDKPYLIQRFCKPAITSNVDMVDGELQVGEYKNITGLYIYNEKVYGVYSRAGRTAIISGLHDVFTLPTFFVKTEDEMSLT